MFESICMYLSRLVFVTNYLKESINIDDKCGQKVHVLFFILRTVFGRVYSCLHLFFPVISCPHFPFFSIFSLFIPHCEKGHFITDAESLRELESWTFLVSIRLKTTLRAVVSPGRTLHSVASGLEKQLLAGYLKTVLCQSLSELTNLVPRPTQILLAFWSADFPGIYESLNVREVKFPSRFQVHYRP